jgi:[acyl-carrier-protein] S-malonyltransferase
MSVITAFLFPGQGAQEIGMASDVVVASAAAKAIFDEADDVLGISLGKIILEGPAEELVRSHNAQPAILTASIALLRGLEERMGDSMPVPTFVAGHSLGEYTALVATGSLDFAQALRLVRRRGELMQAAAQATPSGMAALIGLTLEAARAACKGTGAEVANSNSEQQVVIAGPNAALELAIERAKEAGARRALPLELAGAFHTRVMQPAQDEMDRLFAETVLSTPSVPVIGNTTATPLVNAEDIRAELADQLCGCVYWQQTIEYMIANGVERYVEIGPGKVLTGLARRIATGAETVAIGDLDALDTLT